MIRLAFERLMISAAVWIAIARFGAMAVQARGRRLPQARLRVIQGGLRPRSADLDRAD